MRTAHYHKRTNGPERSSIFYYFAKTYSAPSTHRPPVDTKYDTESDPDTDSAEAGGSARALISRNDAITAQQGCDERGRVAL